MKEERRMCSKLCHKLILTSNFTRSVICYFSLSSSSFLTLSRKKRIERERGENKERKKVKSCHSHPLPNRRIYSNVFSSTTTIIKLPLFLSLSLFTLLIFSSLSRGNRGRKRKKKREREKRREKESAFSSLSVFVLEVCSFLSLSRSIPFGFPITSLLPLSQSFSFFLPLFSFFLSKFLTQSLSLDPPERRRCCLRQFVEGTNRERERGRERERRREEVKS